MFQGPALQGGAPGVARPVLPQRDVEDTFETQPIETQPGEAIAASEPSETERPESEPMPIDTTAELLGRAKHRKPRTRLPRPLAAEPASPKRARKPAAKRGSRAKKEEVSQ